MFLFFHSIVLQQVFQGGAGLKGKGKGKGIYIFTLQNNFTHKICVVLLVVLHFSYKIVYIIGKGKGKGKGSSTGIVSNLNGVEYDIVDKADDLGFDVRYDASLGQVISIIDVWEENLTLKGLLAIYRRNQT